MAFNSRDPDIFYERIMHYSLLFSLSLSFYMDDAENFPYGTFSKGPWPKGGLEKDIRYTSRAHEAFVRNQRKCGQLKTECVQNVL
jgi:hypothetical protein